MHPGMRDATDYCAATPEALTSSAYDSGGVHLALSERVERFGGIVRFSGRRLAGST
jgi:hypothetical protein